ncbi:UBX domain-containing protein 6 [Protopterus annectens]|uniref:UBX domain-containing protein 6 n=1 Tax=Protopterus annectens TaxID=7888 RepID=UPI001CFC07E6|nr:UBX domain-containing protein 6 [Protopterus annectens]
MKKFFQGLKRDVAFKTTAGPGHRLTEDTRSQQAAAAAAKQTSACSKPRDIPSEEAQMAAAAALARMEKKQQKSSVVSSQEVIRNKVKKELMAETMAAKPDSETFGEEISKATCQQNSKLCSVSGVYFICPLTGASLKKNDREQHVKEAILMKFSEEPVEAAVMMIQTFNKDRDKVKSGTEIIAKYIDNICNNPNEEKYRKIKLQNKVFQEKVSCLEGAHEFISAVGFERKTLPVPDQENEEDFYVLSDDVLGKLEELKLHKEKLLRGEPVRAKLDRQLQIFKPSPTAASFELPDDFYNLTAEEIKREQQMRTEAVERSMMLRTKAMREKDEQREMKKYNYTLLRIRLPDEYILQGTFYAREKVSALYEFVRETLQNEWQPFELLLPGGMKLLDDSTAFNECGLVPAALLTFVWDAAIQADIEAAGAQGQGSALKDELLSNVQLLN